MRLFRIQPDEDEWRCGYGFNASHLWHLPGVKCPACGHRRSELGLEYPLLTLPSNLDPSPYQIPGPVTPLRFDQLVNPLRSLLDPALPLYPGADFGALHGTAHGKHGDFTWHYWTLLISPVALEKLRQNGIATLSTASPTIVFRGKSPFAHLELQIEPRVSIAPGSFLPGEFRKCTSCGRISATGSRFDISGEHKLLNGSISTRHDLLRMREFPTHIYATDRFRQASQSLGLSNIAFAEVELV